jgi:hypothetical protein
MGFQTNLFCPIDFRSSPGQSFLHFIHHRRHAHSAQPRPLLFALPDRPVAGAAAAAGRAVAAVLRALLRRFPEFGSLQGGGEAADRLGRPGISEIWQRRGRRRGSTAPLRAGRRRRRRRCGS